MNARPFPRFTPGEEFTVEGDLWNELVGRLERVEGMMVVPPLTMSDTPAGRILQCRFPPPDAFLARITARGTSSGTWEWSEVDADLSTLAGGRTSTNTVAATELRFGSALAAGTNNGDVTWMQQRFDAAGAAHALFEAPGRTHVIAITGTSGCGVGLYLAKSRLSPTNTIDVTAALGASFIGDTNPFFDTCYAANLLEMGSTSGAHAIVPGTAGGTNQIYFVAREWAIATDGVKILVFDQVQDELCT